MAMDLYPSRASDRPRIIPRREPVLHAPDGAQSAGPLKAAQLAAYARDGFLLLEGVLEDQEVRTLQEALAQALKAAQGSAAPEVVREPSGEEVRSIFAVHRDGLWRGLADDPRLRGVAEQLLGGAVYVHQSRINFKPGFTGRDFYWHSDFETWHVEDGMPRMRAVSFSVLLDDNEVYNGPLMLIPGSQAHYVACVGKTPEHHHEQSLRRQEYGIPDRESLTWLCRAQGIAVPTGRAGSVLIFECNTMHGSNGNITPFARRNAFIVYNSVANALEAPFGAPAPRPEYVASRAGIPSATGAATRPASIRPVPTSVQA